MTSYFLNRSSNALRASFGRIEANPPVRDAGETVEEVSRFLDHSSLAVTSTYLRRLEGQKDRSWSRVADAIGLASFEE